MQSLIGEGGGWGDLDPLRQAVPGGGGGVVEDEDAGGEVQVLGHLVVVHHRHEDALHWVVPWVWKQASPAIPCSIQSIGARNQKRRPCHQGVAAGFPCRKARKNRRLLFRNSWCSSSQGMRSMFLVQWCTTLSDGSWARLSL